MGYEARACSLSVAARTALRPVPQRMGLRRGYAVPIGTRVLGWMAVASACLPSIAQKDTGPASIPLTGIGILAAATDGSKLLGPTSGSNTMEQSNESSVSTILERAKVHTAHGDHLGTPDEPEYSIQGALSEFSLALELVPDYLPALTGAARVASRSGQLGAAERFWKRAAAAAIELSPQSESTFSSQSKLPQQPPAVGILSALAAVQLLSGKWVDAIESFQDLLSVQLESAEAWAGIGLCFREAGRPDEALVAFQRAISYKGKISAEESYTDLLPSVKAGRRWVQRTRLGVRTPMEQGEWRGLMQNASESRTLGKLSQAAMLFRRLLGMTADVDDEALSDAWSQLGLTLLALVAKGEEERRLRAARTQVGATQAQKAAIEKLVHGAKSAFAEAVAHRPFHAESWVNYASALKASTFAEAELELGLRLLRTALELVPQHPRALYTGAVLFQQAGELDRSAQLYQQLLLPAVSRSRGGFERPLAKDPLPEPRLLADGWVNLGLVLSRHTAQPDYFTKSLKCFQNAIEIQPRTLSAARAYYHLGQAYQSIGMLSLAVSAYAQALQHGNATVGWDKVATPHMPNKVNAYLNMAMCQQQMGDVGKAVALYKVAYASARQSDHRPMLALGRALQPGQLQDSFGEEAWAAFTNALKLEPLDPAVWVLGANLAVGARNTIGSSSEASALFAAVLQSVDSFRIPAGITALFTTVWLNSPPPGSGVVDDALSRACQTVAQLLESNSADRSLPALWASGKARELCGRPSDSAAAYAALRAVGDDWQMLSAGRFAAMWLNRLNLLPVDSLANKALLTANLRRLQKEGGTNVELGVGIWPNYPTTFLLPSEEQALATAASAVQPADSSCWVVKPSAQDASGGQALGLVLYNGRDPVPSTTSTGYGENEAEPARDINSAMIAQQWIPSITKPLLLDGRLVTLRLYVVLTSAMPMRALLFSNGHVLLAAKPYVPGSKYWTDRPMQFVGARSPGEYESAIFSQPLVYTRQAADDAANLPKTQRLNQTSVEVEGTGLRRTIRWLIDAVGKSDIDSTLNWPQLWKTLQRAAAATLVAAAPQMEAAWERLITATDNVAALPVVPPRILALDFALDAALTSPRLLSVEADPFVVFEQGTSSESLASPADRLLLRLQRDAWFVATPTEEETPDAIEKVATSVVTQVAASLAQSCAMNDVSCFEHGDIAAIVAAKLEGRRAEGTQLDPLFPIGKLPPKEMGALTAAVGGKSARVARYFNPHY
eukprot:SAG31_NODE_680_length_12881_cov_35.655453_3_plen_1241_part_00